MWLEIPKENQAHRGDRVDLRPHSWLVAGLGLVPTGPASQPEVPSSVTPVALPSAQGDFSHQGPWSLPQSSEPSLHLPGVCWDIQGPSEGEPRPGDNTERGGMEGRWMDTEEGAAMKRGEALEGTLAATVVLGRKQRESPAPSPLSEGQRVQILISNIISVTGNLSRVS